MYVSIFPTLPLSIVFQRKQASIEDIIGQDTFLFRYGRDAIWWGLKILNIKSGENVLIPSSICEVAIQPFLSLGINIKYYHLDEKLQCNLEDIESKIDNNTRAIFIVHYFGFPQDLVPISKLCKEKGLFLIEDCAHSFLGKYQEKPLGSYGDISIFSLRKILPIPYGGCLKINSLLYNFSKPKLKGGEINSFVPIIKLILNDLGLKGIIPLSYIKRSWNTLKGFRKKFIYNFENSYHLYNRRMPCFSEWIIKQLDMQEIVKKRRANYQYWLNNISSLPHFTSLYSYLPEGVSPYSFPVLVEEREKVLKKLEKEGIFLEPTLNPPFYNLENLLNKEERFKTAEYLAERVVSLPVHQSLDIDRLEEISRRMIRTLCK